MSVPFFEKREDAEEFWGNVYDDGDPEGEIVKVKMTGEEGFLQAREPGFYFVTRRMAKYMKKKVVA